MEKLDTEVKLYIQAVWEAGGVITTSITIAAAMAIVQRADRQLLPEDGGDPITLTTNWVKSLLYKLNFVKRKGSSAAKIPVTNFQELKKQYLKAVTGTRWLVNLYDYLQGNEAII